MRSIIRDVRDKHKDRSEERETKWDNSREFTTNPNDHKPQERKKQENLVDFFSHSLNFAEQPKLPFHGRLPPSNLRLPFIHQLKDLLASRIGVFENILMHRVRKVPSRLLASLETSSSRVEKNLEANDCSNVAFRIA